MKIHVFGLAGALALLPGAVMAATISSGTQVSSGSAYLTQFDPSLGTLTAVTGIFSGHEEASVSTNASAPMTVDYSMHGYYGVYIANFTFDFGVNGMGSTEVGPYGPSTVEGSGNNGAGQIKMDAALLSAVTGTGNILATTQTDPPQVTFSGGVQPGYDRSVTSYLTSYELIYTYTPFDSGVPEPASWATMLSGFGLVGGALRRMRRMPAAA